MEQFLRRFEDDDALRETAGRRARSSRGSRPPIRACKRQAIADEWESGADSTSARPLGGYGPMFELLRDDCERAGVRFAFSTRVRRISWRRGGVAVDVTDSRGESQTLRARAAIVTLPVGVLRHRGDETEIASIPSFRRQSARRLRISRWATS